MEHFPQCSYSTSLLGSTYLSSNHELYKKCIKDISSYINGDCWGIIMNGSDILFNSYNPFRTVREKVVDRIIKDECGTNPRGLLLSDINRQGIDATIDIYMFPKELKPMRMHVAYHAESGTYTTTFFSSCIEE